MKITKKSLGIISLFLFVIIAFTVVFGPVFGSLNKGNLTTASAAGNGDSINVFYNSNGYRLKEFSLDKGKYNEEGLYVYSGNNVVCLPDFCNGFSSTYMLSISLRVEHMTNIGSRSKEFEQILIINEKNSFSYVYALTGLLILIIDTSVMFDGTNLYIDKSVTPIFGPMSASVEQKLYIYITSIDLVKSQKIDLNPNNGQVEKLSCVVKENDCFTPPIPSREDFEFLGWYTEDDKIYDEKLPVKTSFTLTAQWGVLVFLDASGGEVEWLSGIVKENDCYAPPLPSRKGFDFLGWYTDDDELYDAELPVTKTFSLTAKWEKNTTPPSSYYKEKISKISCINDFVYVKQDGLYAANKLEFSYDGGPWKEFNFDKSFSAELIRLSHFFEGEYLIRETNAIGNSLEYEVYFDLGGPRPEKWNLVSAPPEEQAEIIEEPAGIIEDPAGIIENSTLSDTEPKNQNLPEDSGGLGTTEIILISAVSATVLSAGIIVLIKVKKRKKAE